MKRPNEGPPVSIKDIARAVGVTHPTVSRALHGSPLVHPDTAARIRKTAEEMGYQVSAIARGLKNRATQTVGVVVTTITDPFFGEVVGGIEEVAADNGYSVILSNSQLDPDREIKVVRSLQAHRVDGIIVAASRVGDLYMQVMSEMNVPIILINNQHDERFAHSVTIDNIEAARIATAHLITLGHKRIAYLGNRLGLRTDLERISGYKLALKRARIPFIGRLVARANGLPDESAEVASRLLHSDQRPSAIFCYNDMTVLGVLQAAAAAGLRVPEDLSLLGFDDLFFAPYLQPPITTVRQPRADMGRLSMHLLLRILAGKKTDKINKVRGELIVRSSATRPPDKSD